MLVILDYLQSAGCSHLGCLFHLVKVSGKRGLPPTDEYERSNRKKPRKVSFFPLTKMCFQFCDVMIDFVQVELYNQVVSLFPSYKRLYQIIHLSHHHDPKGVIHELELRLHPHHLAIDPGSPLDAGDGIYSSRRSSIPGAIPLMIGCLFGAAWAAGSVMEYAALDLATKIFWVKFQTACQLPAATMITCFVLEYAWPGRWLTRRNLALLSVAPLLVLGMILLDNLYHWIWTGFTFDGSVVPQLAPGGWAAIIYSFGLVILNLVVLTWLFLHSPQHRWAVAIMITGHIGVRALYVLEKTNLVHSPLPLDVIGLAFIVLMYAIALFGFRIFDPIPLARQTVIEQLRDGVLVLDPQGRVASLNAAVERILGAPLKQVQGKPIGELLPGLSDLSFPLAGQAALSKTGEMTMGLGAESRCYELEFSRWMIFAGFPLATCFCCTMYPSSGDLRRRSSSSSGRWRC